MAVIQKKIALPPPNRFGTDLFPLVAGVFLFVAILKFGTPVILDDKVQPPDSALAAVYETWQVKWGYWLLLPLVLAGLAAVRWKAITFQWQLLLPLAWLGWQFISATQTVSPALTSATLKHFSACCLLYYLGCFALRGNPWPVWTGMALALCWIIHAGFEQHFGGLEATRRLLYSMQATSDVPTNNPAFQQRIASPRIFATFSNADALAAAIELLLPVTLGFLWQITPKVRLAIRYLFVVILGGCGLACLYWTGSKAGWLVALIMAMVALGRTAIPAKRKWALICGVLVLGLAGMGIRLAFYANKQKEKVSVVSRYAYWRAAIKITKEYPVLGTGPGTFSIPYANVKRPEDDFARLCHNDYLEQACDSGIPGCIAYIAMIFWSIYKLYRYCFANTGGFCTLFATFLGVLGLCLHSFLDYHLYVPSLAWPMFFLLGFCVSLKD
jgi:O-antigen ligase